MTVYAILRSDGKCASGIGERSSGGTGSAVSEERGYVGDNPFERIAKKSKRLLKKNRRIRVCWRLRTGMMPGGCV